LLRVLVIASSLSTSLLKKGRFCMSTGKYFSMTAFEEIVARDPEILGAFYDGSQGRGTMDRYSDLDIKVWVTEEVAREGRKLNELLATLGEVHYRIPHDSPDSATALVGPDWQRVDLDLLTEAHMPPWPGNYGARLLKDTDGRLARLIAEAPGKPELPTLEEAITFFEEFPDSQVFLALHNARGAVWSAMGEVSHQAVQLYTFLARLRGVASYGYRYVEHLLSPEERLLLERTVVSVPEREEVRRAARAYWDWTRYVWRETERVTCR
jgi:hypothetical protein